MHTRQASSGKDAVDWHRARRCAHRTAAGDQGVACVFTCVPVTAAMRAAAAAASSASLARPTATSSRGPFSCNATSHTGEPSSFALWRTSTRCRLPNVEIWRPCWVTARVRRSNTMRWLPCRSVNAVDVSDSTSSRSAGWRRDHKRSTRDHMAGSGHVPRTQGNGTDPNPSVTTTRAALKRPTRRRPQARSASRRGRLRSVDNALAMARAALPALDLLTARGVRRRAAATTLVLRDAAPGIEVLMVKRSPHASFMPGSYVFPGGAVDTADADAALDEPRDALRLRVGGVTGVGEQAPAVAVAALRECREECHLDLGSTRALQPWSRWVTPLGLPKRFDTVFFVARAPTGQVPRPDAGETTTLEWVAPGAALAAQ